MIVTKMLKVSIVTVESDKIESRMWLDWLLKKIRLTVESDKINSWKW